MRDNASIRQQVIELQAAGSEVVIALLDGSKVDGRVVSVDATSFTLRASNGQDRTLPFIAVVSVKEQGPRASLAHFFLNASFTCLLMDL
jgi:hypothetical protein